MLRWTNPDVGAIVDDKSGTSCGDWGAQFCFTSPSDSLVGSGRDPHWTNHCAKSVDRGNARSPVSPDTPNQIRAINIYMAARSETPYAATQQFFRNNLITQVCVRSLAFVPPFTVN
jgi:hypothetical protein